jgi:hypothetical protein
MNQKIRKYNNPTFTGVKSSDIVYAEGGNVGKSLRDINFTSRANKLNFKTGNIQAGKSLSDLNLTKSVSGKPYTKVGKWQPTQKEKDFLASKEGNNSFTDVADSLIPYASNISNALRKLPKPIASRAESTISPNLVNLDAARTNIDNSQRNLDRETDYRVSNPAVAQAIKAATFEKTVNAKNQLAQEETNQNAQIKNQTSQFNQGVIARNIQRENEFNTNLVGRNIQQQNLLSDNLADVGTKFQQQKADNAAIELEREKNSYLPDFYEKNTSGTSVYDRLKAKRSKRGYALGGEVDPDPKKIPWKKSNEVLFPTTFKENNILDSAKYDGAKLYKAQKAKLNNYQGINGKPLFTGVAPNRETPIKESLTQEEIDLVLNKPFNRGATVNKNFAGDNGYLGVKLREYDTERGTEYGADEFVLRRDPVKSVAKPVPVKVLKPHDIMGKETNDQGQFATQRPISVRNSSTPKMKIKRLGGKLKRC